MLGQRSVVGLFLLFVLVFVFANEDAHPALLVAP